MGKPSRSVFELSPKIRAPATTAISPVLQAMQDRKERPDGFLKGWIRYD
jgi:hypothetical protein